MASNAEDLGTAAAPSAQPSRAVQFFAAEAPRDGLVTREDGRVVAFAEWGNADATPLLVLWGSPNSRLWAPRLIGDRHVVTLDRPGWGRSSSDPGQTLTSVAADAGAVMDHLGIDSFGVLALSGGVPYACACAALFGDRVRTLGLVAGLSPQPRPGGFSDSNPAFGLLLDTIARDREAARGLVTAFAGAWVERPESFFSEESRARFLDSHLLDAGLRDAFRQGADGLFGDLACWFSPWPFAMDEIVTPARLWVGDSDQVLADMRYLAEHLPGAQLTSWPGADHLDATSRMSEAMDELMATPS